MSNFRIQIKSTSGNWTTGEGVGTIIADVGFSYTDKLNSVNEAEIKISGTGEVKRSLIEIGSEVKIYLNDILDFYGLVDNLDYYEGGGILLHVSGYEKWLGMETGAYAGSPWSSTASETIFSAVIGESSKFSAGTVNVGTSVDFRAEVTDSIWNVISNLKGTTQQDIGIDYANSEVDILDHKGSSTSVATYNSGLQIGDVRITHTYPLGNKVLVYGKSEGETRVTSEYPGHGYDAASQASYGVITYIMRDPKITTVAQANLLADAEVARLKDPVKIYDFEVLNPNQSVVSGDVITLNARSQEVSNEEVRIVEIERGTKGGEEYLTLQVTNAAYAKLTQKVGEVMAQIDKELRDQQTYDSYQDEYSNQNVDTTVGGFMTTTLGEFRINDVVWIDHDDGYITLAAYNNINLYPGYGAGSGTVQVWDRMSMNSNQIYDLAEPTGNQHAATKYYVDNSGGGWVGTATSALNMSWYDIYNCSSMFSAAVYPGYIYQYPGNAAINIGNDVDMHGNEIDNCEDLEVNDIYDYNQGYIYCADDFELQYVERIRANTANLRLEGGTDPVVIGWNTVGGSDDDLFVSDDLDVFGTKNCTVDAKDGHKYIFSVIESPEIWFEEKISSKLVGGRKEIILDERFLASTVINKKHPLHVIVTSTRECQGLWVEKKFDRVIVHASTLDATFDITVSAKRLGYEDHRFDEYIKDNELDIEYKKSKEVLFLEEKPLRLETEQKKKIQIDVIKKIKNLTKGDSKLKIRKQELKKVNKEIHNLTKQIKEIKNKYRKKHKR